MVLSTTKIAIETTRQAADFIGKRVPEKRQVHLKETEFPANIVTEFDIQAEKIINHTIHENFPTHAILSEETSQDVNPLEHKHLWIVDPIDGTIAFAAGLPYYSISVSYFENQKPVSSALYLSLTDEVLWCETGKGAYRKDRPLHVNDLPVENSIIALDQGIRTRDVVMTRIAPPLSLGIRALLITPGEAGNLGLVARGNIQGLVCSHPRVWDYAAGLHLVEESGGVVTDFRGNPYRWFTRSGHIACVPSIHAYILERTKNAVDYLIDQ